MSRALRFAILLVLGLAGLTVAAAVVVQGQTRAWFEKDLGLRARLAVNGAHAPIVAHWSSDPARLEAVLSDLAQDERIMGACACTPAGADLARTAEFPAELDCGAIVARAAREGPGPESGQWSSVETLPGGEAFVSALPVSDGENELGYVVLVQDLSFVARRDARARLFLLVAFGVLALCASLVTLVASRLSWRDWSEELRRVLRAGGQ